VCLRNEIIYEPFCVQVWFIHSGLHPHPTFVFPRSSVQQHGRVKAQGCTPSHHASTRRRTRRSTKEKDHSRAVDKGPDTNHHQSCLMTVQTVSQLSDVTASHSTLRVAARTVASLAFARRPSATRQLPARAANRRERVTSAWTMYLINFRFVLELFHFSAGNCNMFKLGVMRKD
jgi:hypothetical protein